MRPFERTHRIPQAERVLGMLRPGRWVCGNDFLEAYMPRYSAVIYELRQRGYGIQGERCTLHPAPSGLRRLAEPHAVFMFKLISTPASERPKEQLSWI